MTSRSQARALHHVGTRAAGRRGESLATIAQVLARTGAPRFELDSVVANIRAHARVTLNFHPDRHGAPSSGS